MNPINLQITTALYLAVLIPVSLAIDRRLVNPVIILSLSLLLPLVAFQYHLQPITIAALYAAPVMFLSGYFPMCSVGALQGSRSPAEALVVYRRDKLAYYQVATLVLFAVGQTAFLINLFRVFATFGPSAYMQQSPKQIELTFGASTPINYLFFLNIVAACLAYFCFRHSDKPSRYLWLVVITVSLGGLAFTGIKSTVILGVSIYIFFYLNYSKLDFKTVIVLVLGLLFLIVSMFSIVNLDILSRGISLNELSSSFNAIKGYIYYGYINLDLEMNLRSEFQFGTYTFFFITKLVEPTVVGFYDVPALNLLDRDYNMGTFLREYYVDFGFFGTIILPFLFGFLISVIISRVDRMKQPYDVMFLAVLLTACALVFFGNAFIRLQFIYIVVVVYMIEIIYRFMLLVSREKPIAR